jgi:hypothetical protein
LEYKYLESNSPDCLLHSKEHLSPPIAHFWKTIHLHVLRNNFVWQSESSHYTAVAYTYYRSNDFSQTSIERSKDDKLHGLIAAFGGLYVLPRQMVWIFGSGCRESLLLIADCGPIYDDD